MVSWEVRANGTDLIPVTVFFPATDEGVANGTKLPALVYVQGGAVAPTRYAWQAIELAKRGYVVALHRHPLDLAFFAIDFGQATRRALVSPQEAGAVPALAGVVDPERMAVAGHSLGGVVTMKLALAGGFQAAVVQASYSDPADDATLPALSIPTMYLAGQGDCMSKEQQVRAGWAKVPSPSALVVLEGVTHFQFSDSNAEDVKRNCPPSASLDEAHARIIGAMDAFLSAALASPPGVGEARLRTIPSALVEVR
jgi:predicted dienelactone hydrolase